MKDLYHNPLLQNVAFLIERSKIRQSRHVNVALTMLYWDLGRFIYTRILGRRYGTYGVRAIELLSRQLTIMYGRGFSASNLHRMIRFSYIYNDRQIVETLSRKLSWSHFAELITVKTYKERAQLLNEVLDKSLSVRGLKDLRMIGYHCYSEKTIVNRYTLSFKDLDKVDVDEGLVPKVLKELEHCAMRLCTKLYLIHPSIVLLNKREMSEWLSQKVLL